MGSHIKTAYIAGKLKMTADAIVAARQIFNWDNLAEINFLDDLPGFPDKPSYEIDVPLWTGEHSLHEYPSYKKLLTFTTGSADIAVFGEDGNVWGLRVEHGRVTEHEVEIRIK